MLYGILVALVVILFIWEENDILLSLFPSRNAQRHSSGGVHQVAMLMVLVIVILYSVEQHIY